MKTLAEVKGEKGKECREVVFRRVVDGKGRVTLPTEMRQKLEIRAGEEVEFLLTEDGQWYVRKGYPQRVCTFCGCQADLIHVWGQTICRPCARRYLHRLAKELKMDPFVGNSGNLPD